MAIRTYDILLDSYNSTIPEPIVGRQGDKNGAVTLHVTITDRGTAIDLTGETINLVAKTANGTAVLADNAGVTLTDALNGKFDYAIPNALWSEAGKIKDAYFSLNDTNGQQTTYDLIFIVKKAIDISQDKADDYITIIDGTLRDLKTKVDAIYETYKNGDFYSKEELDGIIIPINNSISKINSDFYGIHHMDYATVSTTVSTTLMPTSSYEFAHIAKQGADAALIVMVNLTSETDPNPVMLDDALVNQAINNAKSAGVKITMLKPHLGINWSDGFDRAHYNPSNLDAFFTNWTIILNHYADICIANDIPLLCIQCEQNLLTVNSNLPYWWKLTDAIRRNHANLLLTTATNSIFFDDNQTDIFYTVDLIGVNVYTNFTYKVDDGTLTFADVKGAYYDNEHSMNYMQRIDSLAYKFQKKVYITEVGLMAQDDGLIHLLSDHPNNLPRNYHAQALGMSVFFEELLSNKNICGFSWWHTNEPFDYFNDKETTESEQTMIDYIKKVK